MPVSKKRKKKNERKSSGQPISKTEIASRKRKLTKQQILIYVFSALVILSFVLSFIIGYGTKSGSGTTGGADTSGGSNSILLTPVPGSDDTEASDTAQPDDNNSSSESEAGN